jgi:hypothetical protein
MLCHRLLRTFTILLTNSRLASQFSICGERGLLRPDLATAWFDLIQRFTSKSVIFWRSKLVSKGRMPVSIYFLCSPLLAAERALVATLARKYMMELRFWLLTQKMIEDISKMYYEHVFNMYSKLQHANDDAEESYWMHLSHYMRDCWLDKCHRWSHSP